jgi:diglucosylglycerate octanoyltransferase
VQTRLSNRPLVLVLTDSLAFVGPRMPHPVDDPRLWPNILGRELDVDVEVFGGFGWTARHCWYALGHDPRLWPVLRRADAVILAVGSFDSAPAPLPPVLWRLIPLIRSNRLRRVVAALHLRALCVLIRALALIPGRGPTALRPSLTAYYLQASLTLVRRQRPEARVLGMTPIIGHSRLVGGHHKGWAATDRAIRRWGSTAGVPLLDLPAVVDDHMLSERSNPDGMHLGWEGHASLGLAVTEELRGIWPAEDAAGDASPARDADPEAHPVLS